MNCIDCDMDLGWNNPRPMRCDTCEVRALQNQLAAAETELTALYEQLHRSATVCPKDGCMLWRGHTEKHATQEFLSGVLDRTKKLEAVASAARGLKCMEIEKSCKYCARLLDALSALDTPGAKEG